MTRPARPWLAAGLLVVLVLIAVVAYRLRPRPVDPPSDDRPALAFTDATARAGITFRHVNGAAGQKFLPETMGSGVAVIDFDGDGRPDLFFVNGRAWPGQAGGRTTPALYRNKGDGTFEDVTTGSGLDVELYGMGVAVGDLDNDGRPDIFVSCIGGNRLFRNVDGKRFEDVTARAGLGTPGWPDGSYTDFLKRSDPLPFPSSCTFLDYDGDGRLDLFVCHYLTWAPAIDVGVKAILPGGSRAYVPPQQFTGADCALCRNVDGTRFEDVSATVGVQVTEGAGPVGKALGVVLCDPDGDGWPDLVVANDTVRNFFFHNVPDGQGGRKFEEVGLFSGLAYADGRPRGGMGIDATEVLPTSFAVLVANFSSEPNSLFHRVGTDPLRFNDVAPDVGLAAASRYPMKFGALFFDADLDGRPDLFTANGHLEPDIAAAQPGQTYPQPAQLFWNTGDWKGLFAPAGGNAFPPMVGRGCAYLDFDGDGKLDLVVTENNGPARLFRNETPTTNHAIRLNLVGGAGTNRDAIGASIEVEAGGVVRRWYVTPTHGYLSQSEKKATIGLGSASRVDRVTVRWPNARGRTQEWRGLDADRTYTLTEGVAEARPSK
jgi:enediyne biosynthesis protein E4